MNRVSRRDALKLVAAAGAAGAVATGVGARAGGQKGKAMNARTTSKVALREPSTIGALTPLGFQWPTSDPFIFCVHHDDRFPAGNEFMGPEPSLLAGRNMGQDFEALDGWRMYHGERVPGFPQHPHRGFETVTVVRRGLLDHSDSLGAAARYGGGDVQWLTAGSGILHSEMFPLLNRDAGNPLELFQIWLNLPAQSKFVDPYFEMLWNEGIPRHVVEDEDGRPVQVTMVAGRLADKKAPPPPPNSWAARAESDVAIWTIRLAPAARWSVPAASPGSHRSLYFFRGTGLRIDGRAIPDHHRVEVAPDRALALEGGTDENEILLLQGRPIAEPVVQRGPFVMNTPDQIRQAFMDFQRTRFGGWPWPSDEPVHPRQQGRFARRPNGRIERPA